MNRRLERLLIATLKAQMRGSKVAPPEAGRPLWMAFLRLCHTRTYHAVGPNPIQPSEVEAYCSLMRLPLQPAHVATLLAMDRAWLDNAYERRGVPEGVKALPMVSNHPLSAALFDLAVG